jgi:hypothetical protein
MSKHPYNTAAWQRLREAKLSESPLCQACLRREVVEPAIAVDHVVAIAKGGDPFPPLSGLMSLCESCHNSKTRRLDSADSGKHVTGFKGCDTDGSPLDPDDPWYAGTAARQRQEAPAGHSVAASAQSQLTASPVAARGTPAQPGAFEGRELHGSGPRAPIRKDLVLESLNKGEADRWV